MSYASEVAADSPLGYWRLGDASGTTMTDSSGSSRDGLYVNSPTLGATGLLTSETDTAVSFDGSNDYALVTAASWMDVANFSIEAWIKPSAVSGNKAIAGRDGTSGRGWNLYLIGNHLGGADASLFLTGTIALSAGSTYHVVMTYDGTTIRQYVNAVADGSVTRSLTTALSPQNLLIGASQAGTIGGPFNFFPGVIEKVAYYSTALSGARISAHYAAGTAASPDATVTPPAATATAAARVPVVSAAATVTPPAAAATASAVAPVVSTGTNATVLAPAATATAAASAPVITQVLPAGTDTSNSLNGRRRRARASVVMVLPAAAAPSRAAVKYDKSVPYPPPTLVNGRPT